MIEPSSTGSSRNELGATHLPPILLGRENELVVNEVRQFYDSVALIYASWLKRCRSPRTARSYHAGTMKFVEEFMRIDWPKESKRLLEVSVSDVQEYRHWLKEKQNAAPKTINHRLTCLSSFYKYVSAAASEMRLPIHIGNPAHSQFLPRGSADVRHPTEAMKLDRVRMLFGMPEGEEIIDYRDRALLKFFLYSAVRIGTVCRMNVSDFHYDQECSTVRIAEKGDRHRTVGIHAIAAEALREYIEKALITRGPLFRPRLNSRSKKLKRAYFQESNLYRLLMNYVRRLPGAVKEVEDEHGMVRQVCIYSPPFLESYRCDSSSRLGC